MPIYWDVKIVTCLLSIIYFFSPWQSSSKLALLMTYRKSFILFLAMAKFRQACFAHDLSKKFHTFYTHVIFGCTRHSSNKFGSALVGTKILRSTMPIRNFEFCDWLCHLLEQECWILSYSLLRMRLRIGQLWINCLWTWIIINWPWIMPRINMVWIDPWLLSCLFMQFVTIT